MELPDTKRRRIRSPTFCIGIFSFLLLEFPNDSTSELVLKILWMLSREEDAPSWKLCPSWWECVG